MILVPERKTIQDISREIQMYPDPINNPLLNQLKYPYKKFLKNYQI